MKFGDENYTAHRFVCIGVLNFIHENPGETTALLTVQLTVILLKLNDMKQTIHEPCVTEL